MNVNRQVAILYLDLSKAFDNVEHDRLLTKCNNIGIRCLPLKWLTSFLQGRQFYINCNKLDSEKRSITKGVPQGSILSPLLFNTYLHNIPNYNNTKILQYADDTTIIFFNKNSKDLKHLIESTYRNLKSYLQKTVSHSMMKRQNA
mgnify:CR=1 FL=1